MNFDTSNNDYSMLILLSMNELDLHTGQTMGVARATSAVGWHDLLRHWRTNQADVFLG